MDIALTVKNYRCFSPASPLSLTLRPGYLALVGPNNCGKSTVLRFFYEFRGLFKVLRSLTSELQAVLGGGQTVFNLSDNITDVDSLFTNATDGDLEIDIRLHGDTTHNPVILGARHVKIGVPRRQNTFTLSFPTIPSSVPKRSSNQGTYITWPTEVCGRATSWGMLNYEEMSEAFSQLSEMHYVGPFRNAISVGTTSQYFDIQTGISFIEAWKRLKTGNIRQQNESARRVTEDIRRIFNFSALEINASDDGKTLQLFIGERSYVLSEVGAGLSQFVLVLANAAVQNPSYILIDEPELHLHPALQLDLLTALGRYARLGVIFSTHSIGLARAGSERVYSIRDTPGRGPQLRPLETASNLAELMGELSFSSFRELGFDQVLLVEGPTDALVFRHFLRLYRKEHKVFLLPLSGDSLIHGGCEPHLLEIRRISEKITAVIDSERSAADAPLAKNRTEFVAVCKRIGIRCHVLERRAIENYLSARAIQRVKPSSYRELAPFESRSSVSPVWGKGENPRIASEMALEELDPTDIGTLLSAL